MFIGLTLRIKICFDSPSRDEQYEGNLIAHG